MGAVASALLVVPVAARGADAPSAAADEEFLAYLGSWDGDDSDWIVLQGGPLKPASPTPAERTQKVAEGSDQAGGKVPQERMK
jgi:hypothetical protein